jgi:hypothetical protein
LAASVRWTQGCVQPARAFAGSTTVAAVNTAKQTNHLHPNDPIIAKGRLENREDVWNVDPKYRTNPETRLGSTSCVTFQT